MTIQIHSACQQDNTSNTSADQQRNSNNMSLHVGLPAGWLDHNLVEAFCVQNEGNGKRRLTTAVIDCPTLWIKFRKELYPEVTKAQYRGALRRLCFDFGAGYRPSPLRTDLRKLLGDYITELGKKRWKCFKAPTAQEQNVADNLPTLKDMLLDPNYSFCKNEADSNVGDDSLARCNSSKIDFRTQERAQKEAQQLAQAQAQPQAYVQAETNAQAEAESHAYVQAETNAHAQALELLRENAQAQSRARAHGQPPYKGGDFTMLSTGIASDFDPLLQPTFIVNDIRGTLGSDNRGSARTSSDGGSWSGSSSSANASASNSPSPRAVHRDQGAFAPRTRSISQWSENGLSDEEIDEIDSNILDVFEKDAKNEEDEEVSEVGRLINNMVSNFEVVDNVMIESDQDQRAVEKHYTSCFKYPELVAFVLVPKYQAVDFTPHSYTNKQANQLIGTDMMKEFHQAFTLGGYAHATALMMKIMRGGPEPWHVHPFSSIPFNCFEADGSKCIRNYDVWATMELFNDEHFMVVFSPAGENELLYQPGRFLGDSPGNIAAASEAV